MDQTSPDEIDTDTPPYDPRNPYEERDVHVITPEDSIGDENERAEEEDDSPSLRADDIDTLVSKYCPKTPDLDTVDETSFTWDIENWRSLSKRERGPIFKCGDFPWRVLFFPFGNNVDHASFYLEHGFDDKPGEDWYACAQFMLVLWNPKDPRVFTYHTASHRFTQDEGDWGFTRFAELRKIMNQPWEKFDRPMVEGESAKLTAFVRIVKDPTGVLWHSWLNYDSKKETGMVGLKNQGATCYLNSLLQSLYFTTAFRKAVYQIPTDIEESPRSNSAYALQRLFLQLQTSNNAIATNELTASFGWDSRQIFEQQDVQELSRVLMERLEKTMKGTEAENALGKMFVGKMKTYISCINVDFQSSRIEEFWDLQLNVSKMTGIDDSFREYCLAETMEGDNKYMAEGFGLQDAKKGVIFESFPSVLHLQLKRFEYDFQRDTMMKINDRYEFPETWDASPYLSEDADRSEPYIYKLHGVLVHSGDLNAGHYYAFLKPTKDGHFYKFDDDRVTRATLKEATEENFGGEYPIPANVQLNRTPGTRAPKRSMNAYMLVYIRECHADKILLSGETVGPPEPVAVKFAEERALFEKRKKERDEAHLYTEVSVARIENFQEHQGFDIVPYSKIDGVEEQALPKMYRVLRTTLVGDMVKQVAEELGVPTEFLRAWSMVNRQNGTVRPDQNLLNYELTVEEATSKLTTKRDNPLRMWIETTEEKDKDGNPVWGETHVDLHGRQGDRPIVLFLKCFDVDRQTLFGVSQFYAAQHDKVSDLFPQILKLLKWPTNTNFKLYEEIKHNMIEPMKPKQTLQQSEIQDGDIITIQRVVSEKEIPVFQAQGKFTEAREFYDYLLHRITVRFAPKVPDENENATFDLILSKRMSYVLFSTKVGEHLGVDPTFLRFSPVNMANNKAKSPIKHTTTSNLGLMLSPSYTAYGSASQRNDALYYEILEVSMTELEQRKALKITWLPDGLNKEDTYEVLVPKNGIVSDALEGLQRKAAIPDDVLERVRFYEVHGNKIYRICAHNYAVTNFNDYTGLYAEPTPLDELNPGPGEHLANAFHFDKEINKPHGHPFPFLVKEGELFSATKERLSKRTGLKGKSLEKIKFAVVTRSAYSKPEYLTDEDMLSEKLHPDDMLGLDHPNKTRSAWSRVDSIFIR